MSKKYRNLFEPIKIGNVEIPNRYSMAPMGPVGFSDDNGAFNEKGVEYYVERAKGGTGLIMTGICNVDHEIEQLIRPSLPCPTMNPAAFLPTANIMTERIHAYGSKVFMQLTAGLGRAGIPHFIKTQVAPTAIDNRWDPEIKHRELTTEEVELYIKKFAMAAAIAKKSGFDGVEVHAVHEGYLLDQFAIALFNNRTDKYGGNLRNRLRFAIEIVQAIKATCGQDFPVSLRYSIKSFMKGIRQGVLPGEEFKEVGRDYEEGLEAAKILVEAGYDALNVDAGTYDSWYWNHPPMYFEDGMYVQFGKMIKEVVDVPVIIAGRMDNPNLASKAIEDGSVDIIGLGRPLLADPYLPEKVRTGQLEKIRPCLSCHEGCMGRIAKGVGISCAVNPACGRERLYGITPAQRPKKVMVVGGGVAGMEVARVAAIRGHEVSLYEKNDCLGGNIIPGGTPHFKKDDRELVKWYENALKEAHVNIHMETSVDADMVRNSKADVVVVATGSNPIELNFGEGNIQTADKILLGEEKVGDKVLVVGAGLVGCETGLWLAEKGKEVTIVEVAPQILGGPHNLPFMNYDMLKDLLNYNKVDIKTSARLKSVGEGSAIIETENGQETLDVDTVILAVGYKTNKKLYEEIKHDVNKLYLVGDARHVKNIMYAIWDAYEIARNI